MPYPSPTLYPAPLLYPSPLDDGEAPEATPDTHVIAAARPAGQHANGMMQTAAAPKAGGGAMTSGRSVGRGGYERCVSGP